MGGERVLTQQLPWCEELARRDEEIPAYEKRLTLISVYIGQQGKRESQNDRVRPKGKCARLE